MADQGGGGTDAPPGFPGGLGLQDLPLDAVLEARVEAVVHARELLFFVVGVVIGELFFWFGGSSLSKEEKKEKNDSKFLREKNTFFSKKKKRNETGARRLPRAARPHAHARQPELHGDGPRDRRGLAGGRRGEAVAFDKGR